MDISNPQNWSVIYSSSLRVNVTQRYNNGGYNYDPLADIETSLATPIGLVSLSGSAIYKPTGKPQYGVGAWLDAYLPIAGQESKVYTKPCRLNTSTLLQLPNYGYFPYKLRLGFPYWVEQLDIVIRQFTDLSGRYLSQDESVLLSAVEVVEMRENELSQRIEQLTQRLSEGG